MITKLLNKSLKYVVDITIFLLDIIYPMGYRRFFVLETIARIPYFSYISVLNLYESLGKHPSYELMDLHFQQAQNEEYHLLIMEELGGGDRWLDRFLARTLGVFYYWVNCALYLIFPHSAYYLMEIVEDHASQSYTDFLQIKTGSLKETPAKERAREYYFSKFRLANDDLAKISLLDIFESIRDDEKAHSDDMKTCSTFQSLRSNTPGSELHNKRSDNLQKPKKRGLSKPSKLHL
jgi:ubiquinol oxidase